MLLIDENFRGPSLHAQLAWWNPPASFALAADGLCFEPSPQTDLWQRTHYGFQVDNAHALLATLNGDFTLECSVRFDPAHQYDQAGLLVRLSSGCWLKTSIEFEGAEPSRLGSVVTNAGWSDWATQDVPASIRGASYRVRRRRGDYLVEHVHDDGRATQLRIAHLHEDDGSLPVQAGIYACSPGKNGGFRVQFQRLVLSSESAG